jgi:hypothetical protein
MWVLGIFQPFSLSKTTNISHDSVGEAWRTDAKWIKEMVLEQTKYLREWSHRNNIGEGVNVSLEWFQLWLQ